MYIYASMVSWSKKEKGKLMTTLWVNFNFEVPFDVEDQEDLHEQVKSWFQDIREDNLPYYEVRKEAQTI
mgnify:CR=1 FL=1